MRRLFALAIFFSASLLFIVQPLAGKILLPVLGGSPAVWSTCIVFFQAVLLIGYLYAHALSTRVARRWQWPLHLVVLIAASITLPLPVEIGEPGGADPQWWALRALAGTVGLPFVALSATAPLLQHWFWRTDDPRADDPYFLYSASNAGSLLGLLAYLLIEPVAARSVQARAWSAGFWALATLVGGCGYISRGEAPSQTGDARLRSEPAVRLSLRALWVALALVPSALLLGVTQHLATDVVSAPLLWVVPLALYLATFMAAFSTRGFGSARRWGTIAPLGALLVLVLALAQVRYPILLIALAHLTAFGVLAMLCHTRLAEGRPNPSHLTEYFLCISLGGVLGGAAVALVAPLLFSSIVEYPLAIAAAVLLRPQTIDADRRSRSPVGRWAVRAIAVTLFVAGASVIRTGGEILHRERTFFGVHRVTSIQNGDWHELTHGTTTHGVQAFRGKVHVLPTAYYHPSGPFGDVVFTLSPDGRFRDIAVVGLGAGALAAYAGNGVRMDFFEIDPAVIRIAENPRYFTYLADARARQGATVRTTAIDGRLGLRAMPVASYDLIVIDAFSSDAIPTHLITREAVALYESRLKPRGLIAFHVSSRFFDLPPVVARIAADRGLVCYVREDKDVPPEKAAEGMRASVWVLVARDENDMGQLAHSGPRWIRLVSDPGAPLWTDDYTNVLGVLDR